MFDKQKEGVLCERLHCRQESVSANASKPLSAKRFPVVQSAGECWHSVGVRCVSGASNRPRQKPKRKPTHQRDVANIAARSFKARSLITHASVAQGFTTSRRLVMRNKIRGQRSRLLPEQRKRNSPLFRCRFCGQLLHRDKGASLLCEADKSCACPLCVTRFGLDTAPSIADVLEGIKSEGVCHG